MNDNFLMIRTSNQAVLEQKKLEEEMGGDVDTANRRIQEINVELESVIEQLGEAKVHARTILRKK